MAQKRAFLSHRMGVALRIKQPRLTWDATEHILSARNDHVALQRAAATTPPLTTTDHPDGGSSVVIDAAAAVAGVGDATSDGFGVDMLGPPVPGQTHTTHILHISSV